MGPQNEHPPRVTDWHGHAEAPGAGQLLALCQDHAAVVWRGFWPGDRATRAAAAVAAHRDVWTKDFRGLQFCLGSAWYTHLETGRTATYFAGAATSDSLVERVIPGLQGEMAAALSVIVGKPVERRRGFCGAGVHIFPAHGLCAVRGGEIHYDDEGLTRAQLRARTPALSLVLVLQAPEGGAGLRLWDVRYHGDARAMLSEQNSPSVEVKTSAGDLVVFDSYRLHQIQPFGGDLDRVSATLHGAELGARWESWF